MSKVSDQGVIHYNQREYAQAKEFFNRSIAENEKDSGQALYLLGVMYNNGNGVSQDYARAKDLYERAVSLGHPEAMNNLGYMYWKGQGVTKDTNLAISLLTQAGDKGCRAGYYNLGLMYCKGRER